MNKKIIIKYNVKKDKGGFCMDALYVRQSVDKKDSISIEAQIEMCAVQARGEYTVFADKGFSGKNTNRPAFKNMLNQIRNKSIDRIIVYRIDRLSRSIADFSVFWQELEKYGVEFLSVNEKFDTSSPIGRAMLYIIMSFAQLERETIAERIRDNYFARFKRGVWTGGPAPLGFDIVKEKVDGKKVSYLRQNAMIEVVKTVFNIYCSGESLYYTAEKAGILCPEKYWDSRAVSRIIKNPVYAACNRDVYWYYAEKGIEIENDETEFNGINAAMLTGKEGGCAKKLSIAGHKGVIPPDIFLNCNRRLDLNSAVCVNTYGRQSVLSGLLKCGICGRSVKIVSSGKKRYMFCSKGCMGVKSFDIYELEDEIIIDVDNVIKYYLSSYSESIEKIEIESRINNLVKAIEEGGVSVKYINERIKNLEELKNNYSESKSFFDLNIKNLDFEKKKLLLSLMIEKIILNGKTAHIFYGI